jgi:hypothetical protein
MAKRRWLLQGKVTLDRHTWGFLLSTCILLHEYLYTYMTIIELKIHLESTKAFACIRPGAER